MQVPDNALILVLFEKAKGEFKGVHGQEQDRGIIWGETGFSLSSQQVNVPFTMIMTSV